MAGSQTFLEALAEAHDWCEALGHSAAQSRHGRIVRDPGHPEVWSANHMSGVRARTPSEIEEALADLDAAFAGSPYRVVDTDALTPPAFLARLAMEDFQEQPAVIVMALEGPLAAVAAPPDLQIRPVVCDADWEAFRDLHRLDCEEGAEAGRPLSNELIEGLFDGVRRKAQAGRLFLGRLDGRPCARAIAIRTPGGFGLVDEVFTVSGRRRQGVASAMIAYGVEQLRAGGAKTAFLTARVPDRPKQLYARLGFRPVMLARRWVKSRA